MKIKSRSFLIFSMATALVVSIGSYWYYSPYLALKNIRDAALSKDADAFNERVDYPKVRESLKGQIAAMMSEKATSSDKGYPNFGPILGMAFVNPMVDALVRPEAVMHVMQNGEIKSAQSSVRSGTQAMSDKKPVEWMLERKNVDKIIIYRHDPSLEVGKDFIVVFERNGFADWKLTEIRIDKIL